MPDHAITLYTRRGQAILLDATDESLVSHFTWYLDGRGYVQAYVRGSGRSNCRTVKLHRLLLNAPKGTEVDHINGDPLDNRRSNLRLASHSENMQNRARGAQKNNHSSGIRGVTWSKAARKWQAQLMINRKAIYLGIYDHLDGAETAAKEGRARLMTHA